jgi:hypothetical protein
MTFVKPDFYFVIRTVASDEKNHSKEGREHNGKVDDPESHNASFPSLTIDDAMMHCITPNWPVSSLSYLCLISWQDCLKGVKKGGFCRLT